MRWLTVAAGVVVGVGLAAAALHALLATPPARRAAPRAAAPPVSARAGGAAAHEDIDDASRARLERVLRESEGVEAEP
jgi:hypothetical protein